MYEEQQYIFDVLRVSATGYLLKDSESSQIVAAVCAIYRGESLIHPSVAGKILAEFSLMAQKKGKKPGWVEHDLTEREITVLRLVVDGKPNEGIANHLDLSEKTIKNHVRNIFPCCKSTTVPKRPFYQSAKASSNWIRDRGASRHDGNDRIFFSPCTAIQASDQFLDPPKARLDNAFFEVPL